MRAYRAQREAGSPQFTLNEIGDALGASRQRVFQLVRKASSATSQPAAQGGSSSPQHEGIAARDPPPCALTRAGTRSRLLPASPLTTSGGRRTPHGARSPRRRASARER